MKPTTEVGFASFLSGGFITAIVVNPPERKLAKRTSVHWFTLYHFAMDNPVCRPRDYVVESNFHTLCSCM